MTLNDLQDINS